MLFSSYVVIGHCFNNNVLGPLLVFGKFEIIGNVEREITLERTSILKNLRVSYRNYTSADVAYNSICPSHIHTHTHTAQSYSVSN